MQFSSDGSKQKEQWEHTQESESYGHGHLRDFLGPLIGTIFNGQPPCCEHGPVLHVEPELSGNILWLEACVENCWSPSVVYRLVASTRSIFLHEWISHISSNVVKDQLVQNQTNVSESYHECQLFRWRCRHHHHTHHRRLIVGHYWMTGVACSCIYHDWILHHVQLQCKILDTGN